MGKKTVWRCDSASGPLLVHHQMGWTLQFRSSTPFPPPCYFTLFPTQTLKHCTDYWGGNPGNLPIFFVASLITPNNRSQGFPWFFCITLEGCLLVKPRYVVALERLDPSNRVPVPTLSLRSFVPHGMRWWDWRESGRERTKPPAFLCIKSFLFWGYFVYHHFFG